VPSPTPAPSQSPPAPAPKPTPQAPTPPAPAPKAADPPAPPPVAEPEPEPASADPKQALIDFLASPTVADANATTRYLEILGYLERDRPGDFAEILDLGGRTRRYFANSKKAIEDSGRSTNPREIPGSQYWAMTGVDTFQKRDILRQAMEKMKYDPDSIDRCVEAVR
jgi:negative modulator of initiation of replication